MYGCDADRRKEALADPVLLDLESLAGMADPWSRQDLEIPGLGIPVAFPRNMVVRKVWTENYPRVGARKAWR